MPNYANYKNRTIINQIETSTVVIRIINFQLPFKNFIMKKHFISLFLVFSIFYLKAQYAPINAIWHFGLPDGNGIGVESFMKYKVIKDTAIDNEVYSVIVGLDTKDSLIPNLSFFVSQKNDTIFYFENSRKILFELTLIVGDTTELDIYRWDRTVHKTKVRIINEEWIKDNSLANDSLRKFTFLALPSQTISGNGYFTEKIIDPNSSGILISICLSPSIPEGNPYIRCYSDSNYQFKTLGFTKDCDYTNVGIEDLLGEGKLNVYPNPAYDKLFIDFNINQSGFYSVSIFSSVGQFIKQLNVDRSISSSIDINDLTPGMYITEVSNEISKFTFKFFKQ